MRFSFIVSESAEILLANSFFATAPSESSLKMPACTCWAFSLRAVSALSAILSAGKPENPTFWQNLMTLDWLTPHLCASACDDRFTTSSGASRMTAAIACSLPDMASSPALSLAIRLVPIAPCPFRTQPRVEFIIIDGAENWNI